jgi:hypothetical protein
MNVSPNYGRENLLYEGVRTSLRALMSDKKGEGASVVSGEEKYVNRVLDLPVTLELFEDLKQITGAIGVTRNFREVIDYFKVPVNETPQGFRIEYVLEKDGLLRADLVRDIGYDKNGQKRPTNLLFSAPIPQIPMRWGRSAILSSTLPAIPALFTIFSSTIRRRMWTGNSRRGTR